jgi:hypothetical protein
VLSVKSLVWSVLLLLPVGALAAEIYRSVDANGRVVYSDLPDGTAERVTINVPEPSAPGERAAASRADDSESAPAASAAPPGAEIPRPSTPEEIAADRTRNCDYARQMQTTYSSSHRLYRNGADGERVYLSDAELSEARAKAESDVATWCD